MPGTPPIPNLTLTVTPPGQAPLNLTANLAYSGAGGAPTISQHFGRQGDTASFPLVDEYIQTPGFSIPVFSQVKLVDNNVGQTLFAGVCNNPTMEVVSPNVNEWSLQCTDYAFYADAAVVHGVFFGTTVDQIIIALTRQANCGITADTVANGGFIAPGPQLASFSLNYCTLTTAWRKLSILAGTLTPFGWYVDENRALHFYDATTAQNSGVTFTTTPTAGSSGSYTEGHIRGSGFSYEWDGTAIRNRILVQGATQTVYYGNTTKPPTDTWRGNGVQNAWPLRYTVIGTPQLQVNGVRQTTELVASGSTSTLTWQVVQSSVGTWSLVTTGAPPGNGVTIKIWYSYQVPVVAQASDFQSQATYPGPNGGVFTTYILDRSLTTVPMALNRAQRERTEYAFAVERMNFTTTEEWVGWIRSGQICTIVNQFVPDARNSYIPGINSTFLVTGNSVTFGDGGYRSNSITAIRI